MSLLGAPDLGMLSYGEIIDHIRRIADAVEIPVIADADTGYGGPLNVIRTARDYENAGISCIQIEDQQWPLLVLYLDTGNACILIIARGADDIERTAITGVCISNDGDFYRISYAADMVDNFAVGQHA